MKRRRRYELFLIFLFCSLLGQAQNGTFAVLEGNLYPDHIYYHDDFFPQGMNPNVDDVVDSVKVTLYREGDYYQQTYTDLYGDFRFEVASEDATSSFTLRMEKPGLLTKEVKNVRFEGRERLDFSVSMTIILEYPEKEETEQVTVESENFGVQYGVPFYQYDDVPGATSFERMLGFDFGLQIYQPLGKRVHFGWDIYLWRSYSALVVQDSLKETGPDLYDQERIGMSMLSSGPMMRFTLIQGKEDFEFDWLWMELGVTGNVPYYMRHTFRQKVDNTRITGRTRIPRNAFLEAEARLGVGPFVAFGTYRFTPLLKADSPWPDFPPFRFGLKFSFADLGSDYVVVD